MKKTAPDIGGGKEHSERVFEALQLKGAQLESKTFYACVFRNCDFTGASFRFCKFRDCRFESCNLSLVKVGASIFDGTSFRNSKLAGVNWTEAEWPKLILSALPGLLCMI